MRLADLDFRIRVQGSEEAHSTVRNLNSTFKNIGSTVSNVGKGILSFGAKMTAGVTVPILGLIGAGLKFNMTMESLQSSFKVLLGSEEKAIDMTKKLKDMAASTPFEVKGLADATKTLLSFGVTEEKVLPIMSKLGDVSLGNAERFKALNLVMGQVSANGKLQGQDLLQFINAGWNPLQQIIARTGETMSEVRDRMSKGKVSVKEVEMALKDATSEGGRFYKGMEEGSKTLSGRLSTLKDNFMELLGNATKPLFDFISQKLVPVLITLVQKFNNIDPSIKTIIFAVTLLAAAIGPVIAAFGLIVITVGQFIFAITTIVAGITALISTLGFALIPIALLGGAFVVLTGVMAGLGVWYLIDRFGSLQGVFQAIQTFIQTSLVPAFKYLASGEGLGKVSENALITHDRLKLLRSKMLEVKNFVVDTLVPALKYLATGEGLGKVKDSSGTLRSELAELRKKFQDVKNFINDTLIPTLSYLVTGKKGSLNSVKGMSGDTKGSIKDLRKSIEDLIKKVKDFDSSSMVKEFGKIVDAVGAIIDAVTGATKAIGGFFAWAKQKADSIKSFIDSIDPELQPKKRNMKGFAEGVINNPVGQFAWVGEKGPEIMYVPRHGNIYTNKQSKEILSKTASTVPNKENTVKTENIYIDNISLNIKDIKDIKDFREFINNIKREKNMRLGF